MCDILSYTLNRTFRVHETQDQDAKPRRALGPALLGCWNALGTVHILRNHIRGGIGVQGSLEDIDYILHEY